MPKKGKLGLRDRFKKKKIKRLKTPKEKTRKLKRKKIYVKEKCKFVENGVQCKRNAIGSGQLCKKHGGEKDTDNTLSTEGLNLMTKEVALPRLKFDPVKHPMMMISLSTEGQSDVEIAAEMGVGVQTLRQWSEKYEAMSAAYDLGQALHEKWWLEKGKDGLKSKSFNTALYKFLTSNKLGYAEKVESKNLNMNTHGVLVVPSKVSVEEWEAGNSKDSADEDTVDAEVVDEK